MLDSSAGCHAIAVSALVAALAATGCVASIGDAPADGEPPLEPSVPPFDPGEGRMRRLTTAQYRNAIRDLFGAEIVVPYAFPPDSPVLGLVEIGAGLGTISDTGVEQYETAAYAIAEQSLANPVVRARIVPCEPAGEVDSRCARAFVLAFGLRAYRRPLDETEVTALVALADAAAETLDGFDRGLEFAIAAMLQSPSFLFRVELGSPDAERPEWLRYGPHELASRLSFFFWNTGPDTALLDAAGTGALATEEGFLSQIDRLLADARARDGVRALFEDMLRLRGLDSLDKDATLFVHMSAELGASAREETLLGLEHLVFTRDGDYREALTTRTAFLDRRLAAIYDVPAPAREGFGEQALPSDGLRRGLLGQLAFLAPNAHATSTSPSLRGKFVREVLLCGSIPPPPAMANTAVPEPSGEVLTMRERVAEHLRNPTCRGCHQLMDPIGLAFESFDAVGRHRETDHGEVIDGSGYLGSDRFEHAAELAELLHDHPDVTRCLVRTMYRYANGRVETSGETEALRDLEDAFEAEGYRVKALMRALARHRSFELSVVPAGTEAN